MAEPEPSLGHLVSELVEDLRRLLRQELQLARSELADKLHRAEIGLYLLLAGLLTALATLLLTLLAVVLVLSAVMPAWVACLAVALVTGALAALFIYRGRAMIQPRNLIPTQTQQAGRGDPEEWATRQ